MFQFCVELIRRTLQFAMNVLVISVVKYLSWQLQQVITELESTG